MEKTGIKDNLYDLYTVYSQYKLLFNFYQQFKEVRSFKEILERIEYLKANPLVKGKTELETLLWVMDGEDNGIN